MNRWRLMGVAAGLTVTVACPPGAPAQAIMLRYAPKVGEAHRYEVTATGAMDLTIEALEQASRTENSAEVQCEEKVVCQAGEVTRLQADLLGGKTTTRSEGRTESAEAPTGRVVVEVDQRGRMGKVVEVVLNGKEIGQELGAWAEFLWKWSRCCALPEGDVKVGDSWADTFGSSLPTGGPAVKVSIKSQLLEVTTFQGRQCAKIRTTFSGPLEAKGSDMGPFGSEGATTGRLQGDFIWQYDYENSVLAAAEGSGSMEESRLLEGVLGPGMPNRTVVSTKMQMSVKIALAQ
jgi:hypothetical protein